MFILNNWKIDIVLLEILLALVYFNPLADLLPSAFQILVFILWGISVASNSKVWSEGFKLSAFGIWIFFYSIIRCFLADQFNLGYFSTFQVVIARYQFMVVPFIYVYIINLNRKEQREIFYFSLACIIGTIIVSLGYICFVDPQAIRSTQRSEPLFGVGDFSLMYSIAILLGPLCFLIRERFREGKKNKYLIFAATLIAICLLRCNLVTSVVIGSVSIIVTFVAMRKIKFIIPFVAIFSSAIYGLREHIGYLFYYIAEQELLYWSTNKKLIAIGNILFGNYENIDTLSTRMKLANYSLQSFANNPILGIDWSNHKSGVIGCHMQWADDLGRYGILGNIVIWFYYFYVARYTICHAGSSFVRDCMRSAWITFFILGFFNPCLSNCNLLVLFAIIPTFNSMIGEK